MRNESKTRGRRGGSATEDAEADAQDWDDVASLWSHHWRELRTSISQFRSARFDLLRLHSGRWAAWAALGSFVALATTTVTITAVVYGVRGLSGALEAAFNGRRWAAELTTCAALLGVIYLTGYVMLRRLQTAQRRKIRENYETRRREERIAAGYDGEQNAAGR